jgi:glycosyltransferase involved in cell wall biosynthesis
VRVTFIAAPLTARSGVYRSGRELVTEGRRLGEDWRLVLGVSRKAGGRQPNKDPDWVSEFPCEPHGAHGILSLRKTLLGHPLVQDADVLVSLIPQTDMALALSARTWVAYVRGLPWPEPQETSAPKRLLWRSLERGALRRADAIWATTAVLRDGLNLGTGVDLVPAGIEPVPRRWDGKAPRSTAVWAARYQADKHPQLFLDALDKQPFRGVLHGSGGLEEELKGRAPSNVTVAGWTSPARLWDDAFVYVGTSHREAFGRSALEAAMTGIPIVISDAFGVAPFLVRDPALRKAFVLPIGDLKRWRSALATLHADEGLRVAYSEHLAQAAASLTISGSATAVMRQLQHHGLGSL